MNTDNATPELWATIIKAQAEIENATKNASNPFHKSKYADLNEVLSVIKPVFVKHKLGFFQAPGFDGSLASITTMISNDSGAFITFVSSCVPAKSDAQGIGAASTYLRRYALAGFCGIYQEDDDGNAAAHNKKPAPVQTKPAPAIDKQNPNVVAISAFRADMIKQVGAAGFDVSNESASMKWANDILKTCASRLDMKMADVAKWTPGQLKAVTESAHEEVMLEIVKFEQDKAAEDAK